MNQYEFIRAKEATYGVAEMCRVLEVSTSAYYTWRNAPPSQRERDDERLQTAIIAAHEANRKVYGSPRITEELQAQGEKVGPRPCGPFDARKPYQWEHS